MTHPVTHRLALAAGVVALLASDVSRADVRLGAASHGPELAIRFAPSGPWSLLEPPDPTVLNSAGDVHGDGVPGSSSREESLLAAWIRPTADELKLSRWDGDRWVPAPDVRAPHAVGVPRVSPLGEGWAVTWQQASGRAVIRAVGLSGELEAGAPEPLVRGWLLDSTFLGHVQLVLHLDEARERVLLTAIAWAVPGVPSPIEIMWTVEVSQASFRPEPTAHRETGRAPVADPAPFRAPTLERGDEGSDSVTVSWREPGGDLHRVMVDTQGEVRRVEVDLPTRPAPRARQLSPRGRDWR